MATVPIKYKKAIQIFPDLKGQQPLMVYRAMTDKGYEWNTFESAWVHEAEKEVEPLIDLNISSSNDLISDAYELILEALQEAGFEVVKNGRPRPSQTKDAKGKLIDSQDRSKVYIQVRYPEFSFDDEDNSSDDADVA